MAKPKRNPSLRELLAYAEAEYDYDEDPLLSRPEFVDLLLEVAANPVYTPVLAATRIVYWHVVESVSALLEDHGEELAPEDREWLECLEDHAPTVTLLEAALIENLQGGELREALKRYKEGHA